MGEFDKFDDDLLAISQNFTIKISNDIEEYTCRESSPFIKTYQPKLYWDLLILSPSNLYAIHGTYKTGYM